MKIALIHDWLRVNAGSEKVVSEIIEVFATSEMEIYTLFSALPVADRREILKGRSVHVSLLHFIPGIGMWYRYLLPVLPFFMKTLRPASADVYISSSHAVAKGFKKQKGIPHICYCHTPMRYVWFLREDYLSDIRWIKRQILRFVVPFIRKWDLQQAQTVDFFIANSKHIQQHISAIYQRESVCIYPPVQVDKFLLNTHPRKDYYLALGRFVAHKKIDVVIEAFRRMPEHKLVLIGDGHDAPELKQLLRHCPNIVWLGYQHDDELILYMQHAKACIFAAKEDFGIMCVEAQATGTPVLALRYGGYQETVIEGVSGYFFDRQDADAICEAVKTFELHPLNDHERIREHTLQFSAERFRHQFETFVKEAMQTYSTQHG